MGLNALGLPLSVQLVGQRYFDAELLGIASVLERVMGKPGVATPGDIQKDRGAK